jgi:sulfate adenylyltransferase subunit 1
MTLESRGVEALALLHRIGSQYTSAALAGRGAWITGRNYLLRHSTREVRARIDGIDHLWDVATQARQPAPDTLRMNDIGRVGLTLAQPVFTDRYADNRATGSFILIDDTTNNTVAAGLIQ